MKNNDQEQKKPSTTSCLRSAKMLVPKFTFEHDNAWHIH